MDGQQGGTGFMKYIKCKLCDFKDDIDYQHPLYDGKSNNFVLICKNCRKKIFSDRERSKREDLIEMIVPPEPDELTKKRLEEDIEFVKNCKGINPNL